MNLNKGLPGETPLNDYSGLKQKRVKTVAQRAKAEYDNNLHAVNKYLGRRPTRKTAPFTARWMLQIHRAMYGDVWAWAGKPRTSQTNIGIAPYDILAELGKLELDVNAWAASGWDDHVEQAAVIHHRAVWIHPFPDGNGRWARLLANIWLKKNGGEVTEWPERGMSGADHPARLEYLAALKAADDGDIAQLVQLHRRYAARKACAK
jgi:Fic-DOC domain mobile mystery protein B